MKKNSTIYLIMSIPMFFIGQVAQAQLTAKEHINHHIMMEAMLSGYYAIQKDHGIDSTSKFNWVGTYSEDGWTASIIGILYNKDLIINYTASTIYDANLNAIYLLGYWSKW